MIESQAGMAREYSRISLKVILVLKQPSKVNFWTSKLIFEFSSIFLENNMNLVENQAGMTREYSRMFLKVILVLKQPSKVKFRTSNLIF